MSGFCALVVGVGDMYAQDRSATKTICELHLRIVSSLPGKHRAVPAVIWLEPLPGTPALSFPAQGHYTSLQKNRTFIPHLQVIPVGSVMEFPNRDPFFHNVFSLFDGKRFDLGLYEAGSSKSVTFSMEGRVLYFLQYPSGDERCCPRSQHSSLRDCGCKRFSASPYSAWRLHTACLDRGRSAVLPRRPNPSSAFFEPRG